MEGINLENINSEIITLKSDIANEKSCSSPNKELLTSYINRLTFLEQQLFRGNKLYTTKLI